MIGAEGPTSDGPNGVTGREVGEELAAIVVNAGAGADDDLIVKQLRLPSCTDAWANAPLATGKRGVADARSAVDIVPGDDDAGVGDGVGRRVVGVAGGIKVEDAAVFFGKAAVQS